MQASSSLAGMLNDDTTSFDDTKLLDQAWRGAEAYHLFLLSQKQLYQGYVDAAMKTAYHLQEYDDVMDISDSHSLIGKYFKTQDGAI